MKINMTLNGEPKIVDVESSDETLRDILRREKLFSVKCGCDEGICGCCTILLDGKPVQSCKIPIGIIFNNDIITLEYFSKTQDLYKDILKGFEKAGVSLCGYCNSGKIFAAGNIISKYVHITHEIIDAEVGHLAPCCTDKETLAKGIMSAAEIHARRTGVVKNAK